MVLREQIKRQRVKYIISSYQLDAEDPIAFDRYLTNLLTTYPSTLIELALVDVLVESWLRLPVQKGCAFLAQAHDRIRVWQTGTIASSIAPEQFQQITGLDPTPVFSQGNSFRPPIYPIETSF